MVALALRAHITVHRFVTGFAINARSFVIGIAHPRCGQFGEHRLDRGAGFGVDKTVDAAHPIDALLVDGQMPPPGPVGIVGQITVLIE
jgi:hypothetical protein